MSDLSALEQFLRTDPLDVGCEQVLAVLHIYVDLALGDASNTEAALRYPGVVAHLLACGPCTDDMAGLMIAAGGAMST
jgi:hypothetical protein